MADFGASFKKAREAKGISLEKIAEETRISTRFLRAIEDEEFHVLPGGIFNRGFIRAYAGRVGLDPDQAVADYERLAEYREPAEPLRVASRQASKMERHLYAAAAVALVLAIAIFYIVTRDTGGTVETVSPAPPQSSQITAPPQAAVEPEPAPAAGALALEMEVHEPTWIKLRADGNSVVAGEILQPGTTRRYTAQASINITIGNAGGLTLKLNNQQVPSLGRRGQVRSLVITPENVKDIIG